MAGHFDVIGAHGLLDYFSNLEGRQQDIIDMPVMFAGFWYARSLKQSFSLRVLQRLMIVLPSIASAEVNFFLVHQLQM